MVDPIKELTASVCALAVCLDHHLSLVEKTIVAVVVRVDCFILSTIDGCDATTNVLHDLPFPSLPAPDHRVFSSGSWRAEQAPGSVAKVGLRISTAGGAD